MVATTVEKYARGPNFVFAKEYIIKKYGESTWKLLIENIPTSVAEEWKGILIASNSYSFQAFKSLVQALPIAVGSYSQKETSRMYEYIAERSLNALYKMFFKHSSPSFVLKNYPKLWGRFFTTGEVEVLISEPEHTIIAFKLPEIFLDWLDDACYGYSNKAVEMAGGHDLTIKKLKSIKTENDEWNISYDLKWTNK
jgi:hypothetical protein